MAIATAAVTFTSGGTDSQAFTWTPALSSNPPKVLSVSVSVSVSGEGPVVAYVPTASLSNTGGTVGISAPTDCLVTITGSD